MVERYKTVICTTTGYIRNTIRDSFLTGLLQIPPWKAEKRHSEGNLTLGIIRKLSHQHLLYLFRDCLYLHVPQCIDIVLGLLEIILVFLSFIFRDIPILK